MKKIVFIVLLTWLGMQAFAQQKDSGSSKLGGFLKKASSVLNSGKGSAGALSTDEIIAGLKEALTQGTSKTTNQLSSVNGFFKDAAIKILLPENVRKVEQKMRLLGMGKLVDQAVESMNHAAEDASKSAAPIFLNSIKKMQVQDAVDILKGTDTAATHYLKKTTSPELTAAFKPVIETSLKKVNATKYWTDVFTLYNKVATTPVNTDINAYVTERAMNGIFYYIGEEEKKIRTNPAARVTDILKKVFGSSK
ncbi:MAG: DUF4197 domain-containing protein [Williamsia sp.]|nr:DUF4197 domain-containing protein [Williamsia sp.]